MKTTCHGLLLALPLLASCSLLPKDTNGPEKTDIDIVRDNIDQARAERIAKAQERLETAQRDFDVIEQKRKQLAELLEIQTIQANATRDEVAAFEATLKALGGRAE
ncbi:MAG: hypothetical protein QF724_11405 [Planctomycetota bacterium]|jgi:septal ring factor EnvC (AmiA/AmiB activator)|nr:hypothetical protein [Planctomycetota bacterium]MDP6519777.1 hypothetical protein [Planctomycetota bacterium]MDP6839535.1 hypothetical protein [Planctomycetota bacterium]MDP6954970.1 hypothetical protein [Planctomycetota bacterium]